MEDAQIIWDQKLIEKYSCFGPRYTSYPTALEFSPKYQAQQFEEACAQYPERPLSLYVHLPFCHKLCYYCGCNKIITRHKGKADVYLDTLEQEIAQRSTLLGSRTVTQLHLGGGTPTFLSEKQLDRLLAMLRQHFTIAASAEISIEIDPREIALNRLDHLRQLGFNRISIGVQDFDKKVQIAVNREQDEDFIRNLVLRGETLGFSSINLDLIYGLPHQTPASFQKTVQQVIAMRPQRLSVFNYAHLPARFAAQKKLNEADMPSGAQKLEILQQTIASLTGAGYQFIGMDHFALPDDELAIAQRQGLLHRNFQGYTTQGSCDLLGLGVSSISMIGDSYAQNQKVLELYYRDIEQNGHALCQGVQLDNDDKLRRDIIKSLICNFKLDKRAIEQEYQLNFDEHFAQDLALLSNLIADGLVEVTEQQINVTQSGRLLIRNICMCFDTYLRDRAKLQQFSRVI
ncbi:MAG: oxygen-independent coproporphyrinogen III oxidase [Enterovibrio sp.]